MSIYLVHWLVATLALMTTAYLVPGFRIDSFLAALIAALIVGFVNIVIWPILAILTLPLTILTFGLFLFVVNGAALKIAAALTPGFRIDGFMPAVIGSVVLAVVGWMMRYVVFSGNSY